MNTSLDPTLQARGAARHLRVLVENNCLDRIEFERCMRKIEAALAQPQEPPTPPIEGRFIVLDGGRA
ncbi:hypothetical protein [Phenylobacterium sp.]|uniref:hypothetical protein n=1 Tax=Phenylobacterium sp. TaxID=1871053 RepID=UPI00272F919E|nr:hypothetical protein [Phenylobacterium sp.]MDP1617310.1 hypothetical protein [Phenylobacterium sp.]MDP1985682.1 hypothetical protein [Phenylobacterium sp.]